MTAKTITLTGAETRAVYSGGSNAWLRNDGTDVIYAAAVPGITAGSDGVVSIPAGQSAPVYGAYGTVYLLGTGSVQLIGSDYSTNPFKTSAQSGGSGADSVARAAITAHAGNTEIHVTAAEKSGWDGLSNPNLLINSDFAMNQRGQAEYSGTVGYCVDRWFRNAEVTVKVVEKGIEMSFSGETNPSVYQKIEQVKSILGKTLTLSACINGEVYSCTGTLPEKITTSNTYIAFARLDGNNVTPGSQSVSHIRIQTLASGNCLIVLNNVPNCEWVKLEYGGAATPFAPPDPAAELLRCQRYFTIYKHQNATSSTDKCTIGVGYALTSSIVYAVLPIAAMRSGVTATISHSGVSLISGADTVVDYTSVTALEQTDSTVQVAFTVSGQTPGSVYRLRLMNSDAYLAVSKEL